MPPTKEPIAATASAGPGAALARHLVAVEAGDRRRRLAGHVDQHRGDRAAVHGAVVDRRQHDDAGVGGRAKVTGSSIAVPATGPIPGRTPTSVPRRQPTRAKSRLAGWSAVAKPPSRSARLLHRARIRRSPPAAAAAATPRTGSRSRSCRAAASTGVSIQLPAAEHAEHRQVEAHMVRRKPSVVVSRRHREQRGDDGEDRGRPAGRARRSWAPRRPALQVACAISPRARSRGCRRASGGRSRGPARAACSR